MPRLTLGDDRCDDWATVVDRWFVVDARLCADPEGLCLREVLTSHMPALLVIVNLQSLLRSDPIASALASLRRVRIEALDELVDLDDLVQAAAWRLAVTWLRRPLAARVALESEPPRRPDRGPQ